MKKKKALKTKAKKIFKKRLVKKPKKVVSKIKPILTKSISEPQTVLEQVQLAFIEKVLQLPRNTKINQKVTLNDFCTDKRFEKEFKEMFIYRTNTFFGVSIFKMYNEPIVKIVAYLRDSKMKSLYYNQPTIY
jgi:hypothetical protein